jgi:hypothetical protein
MGRALKFAGVVLAFLGYVWVAGVRNVDEVKARKQARRVG